MQRYDFFIGDKYDPLRHDLMSKSNNGRFVLYTEVLAAIEAAVKEKDRAVERLSSDLSANATMLARQCDMARDAERDLLKSQRQIAVLRADNENMARLNTDAKEKIKEQDEAVYCPTCGACGEEGCCPPDRCKHLKCFYGEHYAKTYRELEAENETLRSLIDLAGSAQKEWEADYPGSTPPKE